MKKKYITNGLKTARNIGLGAFIVGQSFLTGCNPFKSNPKNIGEIINEKIIVYEDGEGDGDNMEIYALTGKPCYIFHDEDENLSLNGIDDYAIEFTASGDEIKYTKNKVVYDKGREYLRGDSATKEIFKTRDAKIKQFTNMYKNSKHAYDNNIATRLRDNKTQCNNNTN